jgi:dienelactone hydrolase
MIITTTTFKSSGIPIQTKLFKPLGTPNGAVIVIAHGSDGMVDNENGPWLTMMTGYATDLADKGFVVLMPHYFGGAQSVDFSQISTYQATLADAVAFAKTLPEIDAERIGLLGFSLGGYLCLRNRALAKVLVEFFAPLFPKVGEIGRVGNSALHVQIHHGEDDQLVKLELNAAPIEQQLRAEGADVDLHIYEHAGHGFSGKQPGDAAANREAKKSFLL